MKIVSRPAPNWGTVHTIELTNRDMMDIRAALDEAATTISARMTRHQQSFGGVADIDSPLTKAAQTLQERVSNGI